MVERRELAGCGRAIRQGCAITRGFHEVAADGAVRATAPVSVGDESHFARRVRIDAIHGWRCGHERPLLHDSRLSPIDPPVSTPPVAASETAGSDRVKTTDTNSEPAWTNELLAAPHDVADKSRRVRQMFNAISRRYALINTLFSVGRDAAWRRKGATLAAVKAHDVVLDLACGTGEFSRALGAFGPKHIVGCDFAHSMLLLALARPGGGGRTATHWLEADALILPFASSSFTVAACAFGVRNFQDPMAGLREMHRVLKPGGRAVILEFSRPRRPVAAWLNRLFCEKIMPPAATWISGDGTGAYIYLPRSVASFPDGEEFCERVRSSGFATCCSFPLTYGIVTLYLAFREPE